MRTILSLLCLLLLLPELAWSAAKEIAVSDGATVEAAVSARELTRITMADGSRLARVWGIQGTMEVQSDDETGEAYIRPLALDAGKAFSFFVRDERGATYTIAAIVSDIPSQTIRLRPSDRARSPSTMEGPAGAALPYVRALKDLVRSLSLRSVPADYVRETVGTPVPLWRETGIRALERWVGNDLVGEIWTVRNLSDAPMTLDEAEFDAVYPRLRALSIASMRLQPGESTELYLVRAK